MVIACIIQFDIGLDHEIVDMICDPTRSKINVCLLLNYEL